MSQSKIKRAHEQTIVERFPDTFKLSGRRKPLAVGIRQSLIERCPDIPEDHVGRFLHRYTNKLVYLFALREGNPRYDLNGTAVGVVSESEAAGAKEKKQAILAREDPG